MGRFNHFLYLFLLSIIAVSLYIFILLGHHSELSLLPIVFWGILAIISATFHFELPSGPATSVGMAVYLATLVTEGPAVAVSLPILAIVDSYDAMTSDRSYRKAVTREEAIAELLKYRGTQFDTRLVDIFVQAIAKYEEEKLEAKG